MASFLVLLSEIPKKVIWINSTGGAFGSRKGEMTNLSHRVLHDFRFEIISSSAGCKKQHITVVTTVQRCREKII